MSTTDTSGHYPVVTLDDRHWEYGVRVGNARQDLAEANRWREHHKQPPEKARANHILGACGELAFAIYSGYLWDAYVGPPRGHKRDVGPYGVRTSPVGDLATRRGLMWVRNQDKGHPDLIIWGLRAQHGARSFAVIGCIRVARAMAVGKHITDGNPYWQVPWSALATPEKMESHGKLATVRHDNYPTDG